MTPQEQLEDNIKKYLDLKDKSDTLDVQMENIRKNIEIYMKENSLDAVKAEGFGKFALESKRSWTFSVETQSLEEQLKAKKKEEQQKGTAQSTESKFLKFYEEKIS